VIWRLTIQVPSTAWEKGRGAPRVYLLKNMAYLQLFLDSNFTPVVILIALTTGALSSTVDTTQLQTTIDFVSEGRTTQRQVDTYGYILRIHTTSPTTPTLSFIFLNL
jgi:hypothetical protein